MKGGRLCTAHAGCVVEPVLGDNGVREVSKYNADARRLGGPISRAVNTSTICGFRETLRCCGKTFAMFLKGFGRRNLGASHHFRFARTLEQVRLHILHMLPPTPVSRGVGLGLAGSYLSPNLSVACAAHSILSRSGQQAALAQSASVGSPRKPCALDGSSHWVAPANDMAGVLVFAGQYPNEGFYQRITHYDRRSTPPRNLSSHGAFIMCTSAEKRRNWVFETLKDTPILWEERGGGYHLPKTQTSLRFGEGVTTSPNPTPSLLFFSFFLFLHFLFFLHFSIFIIFPFFQFFFSIFRFLFKIFSFFW